MPTTCVTSSSGSTVVCCRPVMNSTVQMFGAINVSWSTSIYFQHRWRFHHLLGAAQFITDSSPRSERAVKHTVVAGGSRPTIETHTELQIEMLLLLFMIRLPKTTLAPQHSTRWQPRKNLRSPCATISDRYIISNGCTTTSKSYQHDHLFRQMLAICKQHAK